MRCKTWGSTLTIKDNIGVSTNNGDPAAQLSFQLSAIAETGILIYLVCTIVKIGDFLYSSVSVVLLKFLSLTMAAVPDLFVPSLYLFDIIKFVYGI